MEQNQVIMPSARRSSASAGSPWRLQKARRIERAERRSLVQPQEKGGKTLGKQNHGNSVIDLANHRMVEYTLTIPKVCQGPLAAKIPSNGDKRFCPQMPDDATGSSGHFQREEPNQGKLFFRLCILTIPEAFLTVCCIPHGIYRLKSPVTMLKVKRRMRHETWMVISTMGMPIPLHVVSGVEDTE